MYKSCVAIYSHEVGEAFFEETLVNGHKLGNESFNVENYFISHAESVFVVSSHGSDLGL